MATRPCAEEPAADLLSVPAGELSRRLRAGDLAAREVVEIYVERIGAVNPRLNAVVVPLFEQARIAAVAADAARARGEPLGPLHGVPITVKELFDVAGTPTTWGVPERAGQVAVRDAPLVARLRAAGAILLGKTNVPQLGGVLSETDNRLFGRTNNPWDPERSPGGSSGGEAAIIAARGSALGLGSDIGGSLRLPAHACGIHSLKPTSGRLTMLGHAPLFAGMEPIRWQPGPLARTVADLLLALRILHAPDGEALDANVPPIPIGDPKRVELRTLRVAVYTDNGFFAAAPALRRAVSEAAIALAERGAFVEEWQPPDVDEAMRLYLGLLFADGMAGIRRSLGKSKRDWRILRVVGPMGLPNRALRVMAWVSDRMGQHRLARQSRCLGRLSVDGYWRLIEERNRYCARFLAALDAGGFDAILCPPDAVPALRHGTGFLLSDALSYLELSNLLGLPAGVVAATRVRPGEESDRPAGGDVVERAARSVEAGSAGLPVGVQVVARHWREEVALAIMGALEEWFQRQPDYPLRGFP